MTKRISLLMLAALLGAATAMYTRADDVPPPTTRQTLPEKIASLEAYYARIYSQPLTMKSRLPKLIALMSLSRIDCQATTGALIEACGNKDPIVAYLAWEILHARCAKLDRANYEYWAVRGVELAASGEMPGTTLVPMLDAATSITAAKAKVGEKAFDLVMRRYSPQRPADAPVLKSAGTLLAAWNDPVLIRRMASQLSDPARRDAAAALLHELPGAPGDDVSESAARAKLTKFAGAAGSSGPATRPYAGVGKLVPAPGKIIDPDDPQWRKELELGKLTISSFDLAWVIDSTGSMSETNQAVAAQTARVMRFISLFSDQSRVGAVYFRHEVDPKLQLKCCPEADAPPAYQTKVLPLNKEAGVLAKQMASEKIGKGGRDSHITHPGSAVNGGLLTALLKLDWGKEPSAQHVIILIGDSPLTEGSDAATAELAADAVQKGFQIHAITTTAGSVKTWHPVIVAAKGIHWGYRPGGKAVGTKDGVQAIHDYSAVAKVLIRNSITPQYRDRIDPLIAAIEPFIEQSEATGR